MAGLALGSAIAARLTLRRVRPLRLYAGLESIVAVFGCTLVFGLPLLGQWLRPIFQAFWHHQELLKILRFSISLLVLLLPTTAMGLTLPVLLEESLLYRRQFGRVIAAFYGFNTLGAVAGSHLGEGYMVRKFGLPGDGIGGGLSESRCGWNCVFLRRNSGRRDRSNRISILVRQTDTVEATSC